MRQAFLHRRAEIIRCCSEVLVVRPGQREFHAPARAAQVQAVGLTQTNMGTGNPPQRAAQFFRDFRLAAGAFAPGRQRCDDPDAVEIPAPDDGHHVADFATILIGPQQCLHLGGLAIHVIKPDPVGALQHDIERATIFARQKFLVDRRVECDRRQRDHRRTAEHQQPRRQREVEEPPVHVFDPPPEPGDHPAPGNGLAVFGVRHRQAGCQKRAERQRDEGRNGDRNREHDAEFSEQPPGI